MEANGHVVKLCDVEGIRCLCALHEIDTMSRSSHRTCTDTDKTVCQDAVWESESVWDNESIEEKEDVEVSVSSEMTDSMVVQTSRNSTTNIVKDLRDEIGESSATNTKILECLFDSGMQLSNSSVEILSPEFLRNLQIDKSDKKRDATFRAKSEPESIKPICTKNPLKKQTINTPVLHLSVMKSDGNIKLQKSGKSEKTDNVSEATAFSDPDPTISPEQEHYSSNPEVTLPQPRIPDSVEESTSIDDDENSLENFSREVLFDRNSTNSLSEVDFIPGEQTRYQTFRIARPVNRTSNENVVETNGFPNWLLSLLESDETESTEENVEQEPHFYSQGDGLGIHPSISDISTDTSSGASIRMSSVLVLGADTPGLSDNDNSDEYYSVDEGTVSVRQESDSNIEEAVPEIQVFATGLGSESANRNAPVAPDTAAPVSNSKEGSSKKRD